mgnify:CR=1 FL=1
MATARSINFQELIPLLKGSQILLGELDLRAYSHDGTAELRALPGVVVLASCVEDVSACLRWAGKNKVPVVTRGSGTGLSGGSVPIPGCVVLCLTKFDRILGLDEENLTIRVEPGVITAEIDALAKDHGLFYPPDPGSMKISTIGGNVAENSGGLRGLKYGVTRDYVMALQVVLADGTVTRLGSSCVKDVAGYSLKDLFIGSEGTLGVMTEITLRLYPLPEAISAATCTFPSIDAAVRTTIQIIQMGIPIARCELLDRHAVRAVNKHDHLSLTEAPMLLMEFHGSEASVAEQAGSTS